MLSEHELEIRERIREIIKEIFAENKEAIEIDIFLLLIEDKLGNGEIHDQIIEGVVGAMIKNKELLTEPGEKVRYGK